MERIFILGNENTKIWGAQMGTVVFIPILSINDYPSIHDFVINTITQLEHNARLIIDLDSVDPALALSIAMHIRLSTKELKENIYLPILLVSELPIITFLSLGECSQFFLAYKGYAFCKPSQAKTAISEVTLLTADNYKFDFLDRICIHPDATIGRHSIANLWGADVLAKVAGIEYNPGESILDARKSLYFKYIRFVSSDDNHDYDDNYIQGDKIDSRGKRILLIDDEADKGWAEVLGKILDGGHLDVVSEPISCFDKIPDIYKRNIYADLYDLYLIDLRLLGEKEEHVVSTSGFSGRDVINEIKRNNEGNQVVVITASNKAWNLRNLFMDGANGYYVKESPELRLPSELSKENYNSLKDCIEKVFDNSYKRKLWADLYDLTDYIKQLKIETDLQDKLVSQLNVFETFMLKAENKDDVAATYLTLYQILEIVKQHYAPQLENKFKSLPEYIYAILENFGRLSSGQNIPNLKEVHNGRNNMVHRLKIPGATNYRTKKGLTTLFEVVDAVIRKF